MRTSPMSFFARGVVAVAGCGALLLGMITVGAAPASATPITCGYTATTNVTLSANIDCTSDTTDNGITIGAADITVNLNGHKILGPGATAVTEGIVDNLDGTGTPYNNVTIENGAISNFYGDIVLEGGYSDNDLAGAVVKNVTITNNTLENGYGVFGGRLSGASIHNLSISDDDFGVELEESQASTVSDNRLQSPFFGLYDFYSVGNTWSDNTLSNINYYGIWLDNSTAAVVKSNTLTGGLGATGIADDESGGSTITKNTLTDIGGGVDSYYSSDGTVSSNKGSTHAFGIYTDDTTNYTLTGNQFNDGQYGIETDCPVGELLKGNVTNHNSEVGVFVYTGDECSTSTTYSATLNDNTANDNRFGLYSQIVAAGSGNSATGNTIVNCYDVTCSTGGTRRGAKAVPAPAHSVPRVPPASAFGWAKV